MVLVAHAVPATGVSPLARSRPPGAPTLLPNPQHRPTGSRDVALTGVNPMSRSRSHVQAGLVAECDHHQVPSTSSSRSSNPNGRQLRPRRTEIGALGLTRRQLEACPRAPDCVLERKRPSIHRGPNRGRASSRSYRSTATGNGVIARSEAPPTAKSEPGRTTPSAYRRESSTLHPRRDVAAERRDQFAGNPRWRSSV